MGAINWSDVFFLFPMGAIFLSSLVVLTLKVMNNNKEPNNAIAASVGIIGLSVAAGLLLFHWKTSLDAGPVT